MFSVRQKRDIANAVQDILRATDHTMLRTENGGFPIDADGCSGAH